MFVSDITTEAEKNVCTIRISNNLPYKMIRQFPCENHTDSFAPPTQYFKIIFIVVHINNSLGQKLC